MEPRISSGRTRETKREMKRQLLSLCIVMALAGAVVDGLSFELSGITVEGVIYCRCNLTDYVPRVDASPLSGLYSFLHIIFI
jgi:hypothetical protein